MKKILFYFCALTTLTIFTTSCNKDADVDDVVKTNAELVIGQWKTQAITITPAIPVIGADWFATLKECQKDDILIFEANDVFKLDNGTEKCDATSEQTTVGEYTLNAEETIMNTSNEGNTKEYRIDEATDATLTLGEVIEYDGQEYRLTHTMVKN